MTDNPEDRSFSNDRMRRIIQRAAEVQADAEPRVSARRLGEIAAEVGIDADSLAKAIQQTDAEDQERLTAPATLRVARGFMERVGPFTAGSAGLLVGGAAGALRQVTNGYGTVHVDTLVGTTLAGIAALLIALAARKTKSPLGFQLRSAALWTGFSAGFAIGFPRLAGDMFGAGLGLALVSGVIGALIVSLPDTPWRWSKRARLEGESGRAQRPTDVDQLRMAPAMIPVT